MDREALIENLLTFLPVLYKKVFKGISDCDMTKQQMELLFHLNYDNGKPMNYYGSKLMVSKPNLTVLAEKLTDRGFAERSYLPEDRRVVILNITRKGQEFFKEQTNRFKSHLMEKMTVLDQNDIDRLNELLEESKIIILKLEEKE